MRMFVVAAALVAGMAFGIAQAEDRGVEALNGTWTVDVEKTYEAVSKSPDFAGLPAEQKAMMEKEMKSQMAAMVVIIEESTITMKIEGNDESEQVMDFEVVSHEGDKWTIKTTDRRDEGEEPAEPDTVTIEWSDDDHMSMAKEGDPVAMFLVRKE